MTNMQTYSKNSIQGIIKDGSPKQLFQLTDAEVKTISNVAQVILAVSVVAGAVTLSAIAPNIFQILNKVSWKRKTYSTFNNKTKDQQRKIAKSFYYLKQQGYLELKKSGKDFLVNVTQKGQAKIEKIKFGSLVVPKTKKWDGHWWLVLADVPSDPYRSYADVFRQKIKSLGFYPLQRTVWLYPYDPRAQIGLISAQYNIDRFVTVMEVVSLDPQDLKVLTKFFKERNLI